MSQIDGSSPYLSTVEGIFDLPGRDLMDGPLRFRTPFARRPLLRPRPLRPARLQAIHAAPERRFLERNEFHPLGTLRPLTH